MLIAISILLLGLAVWFQIATNFFTPKQNGLLVLMYHKLDTTKADFLTVKVAEFEKQIAFLLEEKYHFISLSEFLHCLESNKSLPGNSVMLTFDDAYQNNFDYLLPVLKKYQIKANIFLPVSFIGKTNKWDNGSDVLMDYPSLKDAQPFFEYGLHSFSHQNMAKMTLEEFGTDMAACISELKKNNLAFFPALAYPYGRYPKNQEVILAMDKLGLQVAFRIGNKVNKWPLKDRFIINRIDIRGTDSFVDFKIKVAKGRVKMF